MTLIVIIKVVPGSGRQEWSLNKSGELTCYLKSLAQKGLANKELIKSLSQRLRVPQDAIEILAGDIGRRKKIKISKEISYQELLISLGLESLPKQAELFK